MVIGEDIRACGVSKNMVRDREGRGEGIRVADSTCVGQRRRLRRKIYFYLIHFINFVFMSKTRGLVQSHPRVGIAATNNKK